MIVKPKVRGFVCVTAHPEGCAQRVREEIEYIRQQEPIPNPPKKVLVIGCSNGYGLSSRIAAAFGGGADTFGVFYERPSTNGRPATAGYYNAVAFQREAQAAGLYAGNLNGDAFSDELKQQCITRLKEEMGPVDFVIYSLAAPRRNDPETGNTYKSVLKPVGESFSAKTVDTDKTEVEEVHMDPATQEEVEATIKVMGGEDWERWIDILDANGLLAKNARTVAYSYIGPDVTWPIYRDGTIGLAKNHLLETSRKLDERLRAKVDGGAWVSVNKAVATQASAAIPVVPLYLALLFRLMKKAGTHEGCIEQTYRLFARQLFNTGEPKTDELGRIRLDDLEMEPDIQQAIRDIWPSIQTSNLREITDYDDYRQEFLRLFGFGIEGVDYDADVDVEISLEDGD